MIRATIIIALCCCFSASSAQTTNVDSGEHADFSRIVVNFSSVPDWQLGRTQTGYVLHIANQDITYNFSNVFNFIPRNRIEDLQSEDGGNLEIRVDCDCHADAFEIRAGLVIDIKDGPPGRNARFEDPITSETAEELIGLTQSPIPPARPQQTALAMSPLNQPTPRVAAPFEFIRSPRTEFAWQNSIEEPMVGTAMELAEQSDPGERFAEPWEDPQPSRVTEIQDELIRQLGRAASQGLITADLSQTPNLLAEPKPFEVAEGPIEEPLTAETSVEPNTIIEEIASRNNVRLQTAVDRARTNAKPEMPVTKDGRECIETSDLDIAAWGSPPTVEDPLSLSRSSIVGEFDKADAKGIEELAKHYLYLTFGIEARALLTSFEANVENANILLSIADIMDFGHTKTPNISPNQLQCESHIAIWTALSMSELPTSGQIATNSILVSFAGFPLHLRRHLGPMLAQRFLDIEDTETAQAIRDSISRAPGNHGEGLMMIDAEISLKQGDGTAAAKQLLEVVEGDGPMAPDAMVRFIDTQLNQAIAVPVELVETAKALAAEASGTNLGAELMRVYLRAIAHSGQGLRALQETIKARKAEEVTAKAAEELRHEIFDSASLNTSNPEFLKLVLNGPLKLGESPRAKATRNTVASRLVDLGLPESARSVLAEAIQVPQPEERLIFARSYISENRPDMALGYLAGLSDNAANALRAEAQLQAEEYARAADSFASIGDSSSQARAVWRGEDWQQSAMIGSDVERAAATLAMQDPIPPAEAAKPLAANKELLALSQERRKMLSALLDDLAKP